MPWITIAIILLAGYTLIPTMLLWWLHMGFKKGSADTPYIAITFDNAPHPLWTPRYLQLLRTLGIKATFFVTGEKAEKHPELIKAIAEEGHELGFQNYSSHSNWWLTPKRNLRQIQRTLQLVRKTIGDHHTPLYYRPPKGHFTLYNLWVARKKIMPVALWSIGIHHLTPQALEKAKTKVQNGSILNFPHLDVRHAENVEGLLESMGAFLHDLRRRGFQFLPVHQLSQEALRDRAVKLQARSRTNYLAFRLWKKWESLVHRMLKLEPVYTEQGTSMFRIRVRKYRGRPLLMDNGQWLRWGDQIGELHFNNSFMVQALQQSKTSLQLAAILIRTARQSFPILRDFIRQNQKYHNIKAVYGITMIYRGADPLGFQVVPLTDNLFTKLATLYLRLYLSVMHPGGFQRLRQNKEKLVPRRVLMSKEALMHREQTGPQKKIDS